MAVVCSGCAQAPPPAPVAEMSVSLESEESSSTLPSSFGPLPRNAPPVKHVREAFKDAASLRDAQLSALGLQNIIDVPPYSVWTVSKCDLEAIKVFVVSGWAPAVVVRTPVGRKHIRAVIGYSDPDERLTLIDPMSRAHLTLGYAEFSRQWADPQKACLLVTTRRAVADTRIKSALAKYLPHDIVESMTIRAPRQR